MHINGLRAVEYNTVDYFSNLDGPKIAVNSTVEALPDAQA
jgi:hypothetical protein